MTTQPKPGWWRSSQRRLAHYYPEPVGSNAPVCNIHTAPRLPRGEYPEPEGDLSKRAIEGHCIVCLEKRRRDRLERAPTPKPLAATPGPVFLAKQEREDDRRAEIVAEIVGEVRLRYRMGYAKKRERELLAQLDALESTKVGPEECG